MSECVIQYEPLEASSYYRTYHVECTRHGVSRTVRLNCPAEEGSNAIRFYARDQMPQVCRMVRDEQAFEEKSK